MADPPERNPSKLVRSPAVWTLALAASVLVVLALAACGGGDDDDSLPSVADAAPELADLGDLATIRAQPVSKTFGPEGGELTLADGARVEVPEDAFPETVELTVAIVDVKVEDPVESLRVYHLSTVEDVGPLGAPVVLEVPQLADQVVVAQLEDGVWQTSAVSTGSTTRVSIDHFSSVYSALWNCKDLVEGLADQVDQLDHPNFMTLAGLICGSISPTLTDENRAFINRVLDDVANELERAKASNENIAAAKAAVRKCLTEDLLAGKSHGEVLACESKATDFFPTAAPTETESDTDPDPGADPGSDPDPGADPGAGSDPDPGADPGADPGTDPGADPGPDPEPTAAPAVEITNASATPRDCIDLNPQGTSFRCDYDVEFAVAYTITDAPGFVVCTVSIFGGAPTDLTQQVGSGSGAINMTHVIEDLEVGTFSLVDSVNVRCKIWAPVVGPPGVIVADMLAVKVPLPLPAF